jgi:uncharacterized protein (DUF362 family)/Pyruvate/2-oxoacid:ferredoxin oxidoreductase delta subunit
LGTVLTNEECTRFTSAVRIAQSCRVVIPVARVACTDYREAASAFRRALELLAEIGPVAGRGEPLLLKPNLLAAYPAEGAVTTHPEVVAAALAVASDLGAQAVVADSPGLGSARRVSRVSGIAEVCRHHGVPIIDLGQGDGVESAGRTYRSLPLAAEALEAPWLWNLPKWKTHTMMGLTLGVKNLFGCVPGKKKIAAHFRTGRNADDFARQLLDLEGILRPVLTVLDGVVAMEGPGPSRGRPLRRGLLLASGDAAALDWEATRLSGFDPELIPTVRLSTQEGRLDPGEISIVGDAAAPMHFASPPGSPCDWPLPGVLKRFARGAVSPAPRMEAGTCTGCGACVEACPAGALRPGTPPEISQEICIRCYCCQELCPSGAVQVSRRLLPRWFPSLSKEKSP